MIIGTIIFFFFNDTATTEIYTLSLHDALPIYVNNVEYYSYFDTVINTWLIREGGLDIHDGDVIGLCAESHCTFHGPLALPETVSAGPLVGKLGRSSGRHEIGLFSESR